MLTTEMRDRVKQNKQIKERGEVQRTKLITLNLSWYQTTFITLTAIGPHLTLS